MRKYFKTGQMIPCYTDEGRCKHCQLRQNDWPLVCDHAISNAWALADNVLEPVRELYGQPIRVLRCFLCWNKIKKMGLDMEYYRGECADICALRGFRVQGAQGSRRAKRQSRVLDWNLEEGMAVSDVTREENLKIAKLIEENCEFDQLVVYPMHLHVSYKRKGENRREVVYKELESSFQDSGFRFHE